jgi:DNA-directed RNA polymerase specialized sigma24 family protein
MAGGCPAAVTRTIRSSFERTLLSDVMNRSLGPIEPPPDHPRRTDAATLRALVERAEGLPRRLRQVANLCLVHGLSLQQCADHLGMARGTVRVHLRRLRAIQRMVATRAAATARACKMEA